MPTQANLLSIPQELRDKIFEYFYGVSDAANKRFDIRLLRPSWTTIEPANAEVRIPSYEVPPSKDAILVCRQLYMEMSNMQAAAFRRYWNESTFHISDDAVEFNNSFRAGPDRYTQRFKHFIFHTRCDHEIVEVGLHFRAGKWTASYYISDSLWSLSTVFRQHGVPTPQGLQTSYGFEEDVRTFSASGAFSGERKP
ncbi:hypothetical protein Q7P35_005646 [Cladosporium inversicolor]